MGDYAEWEKQVPEAYKVDSIWKVTAYRLALFFKRFMLAGFSKTPSR